MKNMKKVLAVMTAVSAMAASTSAFAATTVGETDASSIITFTQAAYTEGVLSTGNSIAVDAMPAGIVDGEVTLLVLDYATVETAVADDDILYIDQGTYENSTNPFAGKALGLKVSDIVAAAEAQFATDSAADETLETKTYSYPVKLGYYDADDFAIATASIDVTVAKDASGETGVTVLWGDVNKSGDVTVTDASAIVNALLGGTKTYGDFTIDKESIVK